MSHVAVSLQTSICRFCITELLNVSLSLQQHQLCPRLSLLLYISLRADASDSLLDGDLTLAAPQLFPLFHTSTLSQHLAIQRFAFF